MSAQTRDYDGTGVRCMMMRGGTSRGLYLVRDDLPSDTAARDDLLMRLMGTPDPRQIDGLGGATSLTSKVAVVAPSADDGADVDYLFLQVGVAQASVSDRQNCGNLLAGVGPFALERGMAKADGDQAAVRIRMVNSGGVAVARFAAPGGRPEYRGTATIDGVLGTAAPISLQFEGAGGARPLLPTGNARDLVDRIPVTCVDNGMPVVLVNAGDLGLTCAEPPEQLARDPRLLDRVDRLRRAAGRAMGLGDVADAPVPKTVAVAAPRHGGHVATRSFIPVQPHTAIGVLAAISAVTGMLLPGSVGHALSATWPAARHHVDVEHPGGHLLVDVEVDTAADPAAVRRAAVIRTARKLFDGVAFPRA